MGFLRSKCQDSKVSPLSFVVGKAGFVPMKPTTMPEFELLAALLASHFRQKKLGALIFDVSQSFM